MAKITKKNNSTEDFEPVSLNHLPTDIEMEKQVIGAMLFDADAIPRIIEVLPRDSFSMPAHQRIYEVIIDLFSEGQAIDVLTVYSELEKRKETGSIINVAYLSELAQNIISAVNVETHAGILLDKYLQRRLIHTNLDIAKEAINWEGNVEDLLDKAENSIFQIAEEKLRNSYQDMSKAVMEAYEYIEMLHSNKNHSASVKSGLYKLDDITGGFQKSDLVIVAARPSMGKTAFALSVARNAAVQYKVPLAFFSLEMSTLQLVMRMLCSEAKINAHQVRTGKLPQSEVPKLSKAIMKLSEAPIYIDDSPMQTVLDIRAKVRRLVAEKKVGIVMIDYLQLIRSAGTSKDTSREREVSIISSSLKALAKEMNIPVIALAQLNRSVESRTDKIPLLSDLRESGSIEQDADIVMFLHRPEYYGIKELDGKPSEGIAQVIVAKHRNGPTDTIQTRFFKDFALFDNLETAYAIEEQVNSTKFEDNPI